MTLRLIVLVFFIYSSVCLKYIFHLIHSHCAKQYTYMVHFRRIQTRNQGMNMMPKQLL